MSKPDVTRLLESIHGLTVTLEAMRERLGNLEKRTLEPVAQSIVDNVAQFSGCRSPLPKEPMKMSFFDALRVMRQGCKVMRLAHPKHIIFIRENEMFCNLQGFNERMNFALILEDIEAKDWVIL